MSQDQTRRLRLRAEVDKAEVAKGLSALQQLESGVIDLTTAEGVLAAQQLGYAQALTVTNVEGTKAAALTARQTKNLNQQAQATNNLATAQNRVAESSIKANVELRRQARPIRDLETSLIRLSSGLSAFGLGGESVRSVGRLAGTAEGLLRLSQAAKAAPEALTAATKTVTGLTLSTSQLAVAATPALIAIGFLVAAYLKLKKVTEDGKAALESATDSQRLYYEAIAEGTQQEIDDQIRTLEVQRQVSQSVLADIERSYLETEQALLGAESRLGIGRATEIVVTGAALIELNKKRKEEQDTITDLDSRIDGLTKARTEESVIARTLEEATRRLTAAELDLTQSRFDAMLAGENAAATSTGEQVRARLAAIDREQEVRMDEIETLENQRDTLETLGKDTTEVTARIDELRETLRELALEELNLLNTALPAADARDKETKALDNLTKVEEARADFLEDIAKLEEDLTRRRVKTVEAFAEKVRELSESVQARLDDITGAAQRRARELRRDAARDDARAERELEDDIEKLRRQRRDDQEKIERDTNERIEDLRERHRDKLLEIERDFARAERLAILDRDAVALDEARRNRADALEDADKDLKDGIKQQREAAEERLEEEKRQYQDRLRELRIAHENEKRERDIALNQQLDDLREETKLRLAEEKRAGQERLEQLREDERKALKQLEENGQRLLDEREEQFRRELEQLGAHYEDLVAVQADGLDLLAQELEAFYIAQAQVARKAAIDAATDAGVDTTAVPAGTGGSTGAGREIPKLAQGGDIRRNGLFFLHAGERVLPSRQVQQQDQMLRAMRQQIMNFASGAFNLNAQSTDPEAVVREFRRVLPFMMSDVFQGMN